LLGLHGEYAITPTIWFAPSCVRRTVTMILLTKKDSYAIAKSKMTARCALYEWIEWAVAVIWPFKIQSILIVSKMVACRQLGFDVTENSPIRSADPENPSK